MAAWGVAHRQGDGYVDVVEAGMGPVALSVAQMLRDRANADPSASPFRIGEITVSNDIARDPANPWHPASAEEGIGSLATLSVAVDHTFVAGLTLFAPTAGEFDAPEVEMLQSLQEVISRAVQGLEVMSARQAPD